MMKTPKCRPPAEASRSTSCICPDCRSHARLATAWRDLGRFEKAEPPVEPTDVFVIRTVRAVREDRSRRTRVRLALAAAAALLFFFCVGTGHETDTQLHQPNSADAYSSLMSPPGSNSLSSALGGGPLPQSDRQEGKSLSSSRSDSANVARGMPLRLTTAGESHGPRLTAILEGMPAGLRIDPEFVAARARAPPARLRARRAHEDREATPPSSRAVCAAARRSAPRSRSASSTATTPTGSR